MQKNKRSGKTPKERRAKSSREGVKYSTLVVLPN